ncbi:MAG: DNA repair protein RadA [Chloroflexota bacterium]|nr:DNA repair protein RadA [Chloroflexota bacterium]
MLKAKSVFVCQQCGNHEAKWAGRCSECGEWNSLVETIEQPRSKTARERAAPGAEPQRLADLTAESTERYPVPLAELNRVLGGGLVPGSVVLVGGDPGIGKSTLLLQLAASMYPRLDPVLYVAGEESARQVKLRAERLGIAESKLFVLPETSLDQILAAIDRHRPRLVVVDSIQTTYSEALGSAAGTVGQLRECAQQIIAMAKATDTPVFLVGHVTKEGAIAGPRVLEHMVDAVLYLEGERMHAYRVLRAVKNRFGSTDEVGVFEMGEAGMTEVASPSAAFLAERNPESPGSAVTVTIEGTRPILVEVQALVAPSYLAMPRRSANGVDLNRLAMILAVLSKRAGLALGNHDVYVNVVGGLKVSEPAADLGLALAIASSFVDRPLPPGLVAFGEVGLGGELRSVQQSARRAREAAALGFHRCLMPARSVADARAARELELSGAVTLAEAVDASLR